MIMLMIAVTITAVEFVEYCGFNWTIQICTPTFKNLGLVWFFL